MSYTINSGISAAHHGAARIAAKIKYIVVHYTANGGITATAKGNANYFHTTDRSASAHYVVDENSVIYQCVPDLMVAWSVGDSGAGRLKGTVTNTNSISIEMVSHSNSKGFYIPDETIARTIELVHALQKRYGIDDSHVVRHYDVTAKLCPATHCKTAAGEANWTAFKKLLAGETTIKEVDDEVVEARKVKVLGKEYTTNGILKDGSNYLSPKVFADAGFTVTSEGSEAVITMPELTVHVDGKDVKMNGVNSNGTAYCSVREIAEALGKTVTWENGKVVIK